MAEALLFGDTPMPRPIKEATEEKGLINLLGENNCFLNVVIQSLWHLEPFRRKFTSEKEIHRHQDHCVYCALEIIFTQYEFSDESRLPPTALREAMAIIFRPKMKFQLFELDDAVEAFDAMLQILHNQLVDEKALQSIGYCRDPNCVAHKVFGINSIERVVCDECGASSEPIRTQLFTVYTYSAMLKLEYERDPNHTLCQFIKKAAEEDKRQCPKREKGCKAMASIRHELTHLPEVFTVNIAWDSEESSVYDIHAVLKCISMSIDLSNIFDVQDKNGPCNYRLRGMICYYGKHYIAYFYNHLRKQWFVFDDTNVKPVGGEWRDIQDRCLRGKLQPSVLFYESQQPVNMSVVLDQLVDNLSQNLSQDVSHIKIAAFIPSVNASENIFQENSPKSVPAIEPQKSLIEQNNRIPMGNSDPEQSFIVIPSPAKMDIKSDLDYIVTRTNWLYRRQTRIFRFTEDCFKRIIPESGIEKHIFDYKDVFEILVVDSNNIIISFYSGKEAQYIQSDRAMEIVEVISQRSRAKGHNFRITKQE